MLPGALTPIDGLLHCLWPSGPCRVSVRRSLHPQVVTAHFLALACQRGIQRHAVKRLQLLAAESGQISSFYIFFDCRWPKLGCPWILSDLFKEFCSMSLDMLPLKACAYWPRRQLQEGLPSGGRWHLENPKIGKASLLPSISMPILAILLCVVFVTLFTFKQMKHQKPEQKICKHIKIWKTLKNKRTERWRKKQTNIWNQKNRTNMWETNNHILKIFHKKLSPLQVAFLRPMCCYRPCSSDFFAVFFFISKKPERKATNNWFASRFEVVYFL